MDVQYAAYLFLTFAEENYDAVAMWQRIIKALEELEMYDLIGELRLQERLKAAEDQLLASTKFKSSTENVHVYVV